MSFVADIWPIDKTLGRKIVIESFGRDQIGIYKNAHSYYLDT